MGPNPDYILEYICCISFCFWSQNRAFELLQAKPCRTMARAGLGPSPGWGPYGPLWAHMGPILLRKSLILMKNHKIINKNIEVVKLEILKVKTWFGDKDLFS